MRKNMDWAPGPDVRVLGVGRDGDRWVISAVGPEVGSCPRCRAPSTRRHSRYFRHLQDLPVQGAAVVVKMQVSRWRGSVVTILAHDARGRWASSARLTAHAALSNKSAMTTAW